MSSIWGCHRNLFSIMGPSGRCSVSVSIFWPSNESLNDKSESWCFCHVVITIDGVSRGLMSVWLALHRTEIRFRQTFSFFHFLKFTRCLFLLYEVLCHPRAWVALCRIWSLCLLNGGGSGGVSAIVYYCENALTCGWRLTGLCLSSGRLTGLFLCSVYLHGVVWFGASSFFHFSFFFFLLFFFMSLNLSSKFWHLLHNSSLCLSLYSLTAVKSCTCSNFCWWTRRVREGLNVAVFELMVQSVHRLLELLLENWASRGKADVGTAVSGSSCVDVVIAIAVGGRGGGGTGGTVSSGVDVVVTAVGGRAGVGVAVSSGIDIVVIAIGGRAGVGVGVTISNDVDVVVTAVGGRAGVGVVVSSDVDVGTAVGGRAGVGVVVSSDVHVVSTSTSPLSERELLMVLAFPTSVASTLTSEPLEGELPVVMVCPTTVVSTSTSPLSEGELVVAPVWP